VAEQTFTTLATAIKRADDNMDTPTLPEYGYATEELPDNEANAILPADLEELIAAGVARAILAQGGAQRGNRQRIRQQTPTLTAEERAQLYCWTHGPHSHRGQDCKWPATGHIPTATINNQQSGEKSSSRERRANTE